MLIQLTYLKVEICSDCYINPYRQKHRYRRSNLVVVNSLNFVVNNFRQVELLIMDTIYPRLFLYRSIYTPHASCYQRVHQVPSLIDTILNLMVINHLTELGPINASLHVVGSSFFYNNHLFSNLLFDHKINQPDLRGLIVISISGATTLCRHVSYEHRGCHRKHFRCCATLIIMLRFNNPIEFYCPPT